MPIEIKAMAIHLITFRLSQQHMAINCLLKSNAKTLKNATLYSMQTFLLTKSLRFITVTFWMYTKRLNLGTSNCAWSSSNGTKKDSQIGETELILIVSALWVLPSASTWESFLTSKNYSKKRHHKKMLPTRSNSTRGTKETLNASLKVF